MILPTHMTNAQERRCYREAVQASLRIFYGRSEAESRRLVREWWKRLAATKAFESGLFMHAEPINTAGNIADMKVIPITSRNREAYHLLLEMSRDHVLSRVGVRSDPPFAESNPVALEGKNAKVSGHRARTPIGNEKAAIPVQRQSRALVSVG